MHQPMQGAEAQKQKLKLNESKGWGFPMLSKKAHYFIGSMSLCRRWMFTGELEDSQHSHPDNCQACCKKLTKLAP